MNIPQVLLLVPARGGSKGLPGKNMKSLSGMTLLEWTLQGVQQAIVGIESCLILSTDDEQIHRLGLELGYLVPFFRPAELASDTTEAEVVADHALNWFKERYGADPELLFWLQPTSPFRDPRRVKEAIALFEQYPAINSVLGVKELYRTPAMLYKISDEGFLRSLDPDVRRSIRRQEMSRLVTPNGALYAVRVRAFREFNILTPLPVKEIAMNQIESIDIDDRVDFSIAEAVAAAGITWRKNCR